MGIEIEPPMRFRSKGLFGQRILDKPVQRFLREWKPLVPRRKFLLEFLEKLT